MTAQRPSAAWRGRLISIAVVLAFLALAGVAAFAYVSYLSALSQLVIERDQQVAYLSASRLSDEFAKFTEVLESVADSRGLAATGHLQRRRTLQNASGRLAVFDGGVVLLDNFGAVVGTEPARPEIIGRDWSDRDYFRDLLVRRESVLSDAVPDGPDDSWVVVLSVPIHSDEGAFVGALAGMFELGESTISPFYASIVRMRLGQTGNTYVVDSRGRILYDSDRSGIGSDMEERNLPPQILEGSAGALRLQDISGGEVITAFAPIPGTDWVLVTEDDWAQLMSSVQGYATTLLVLLLSASLLPAFVVFLSLRHKNSEIQLRERNLQEGRVARLIHRSLHPTHPPLTPGWSFAAVHIPGQGGSSDFYDHFTLADGRVMLTVGTVTGGSVDSSVVMAITRTALRGSALRMIAPDEALGCSNELLCPDVKEGTTVDCLLASLDPGSARLTFASAGDGTKMLRASDPGTQHPLPGPTLGWQLDSKFPGSTWEILPGEAVLILSAGALAGRAQDDASAFLAGLRQAIAGTTDAQSALELAKAVMIPLLGPLESLDADVTLMCTVRHPGGMQETGG